MEKIAPRFFRSALEFRRWLASHHAAAKELWVGFHKVGVGRAGIRYAEALDEALCFGWIDGVRRSLGATRYTIRFTPRRPRSIWSAVNVARVEELTRLGRMRPAGVRAFAARTAERTGVYSFERLAAAKLTKSQEAALRANRRAAKFFDAQPAGYRRTAIHWVVSAKKEETRQRRLKLLISDSAAGWRIGPLRRPGQPPRKSSRSK